MFEGSCEVNCVFPIIDHKALRYNVMFFFGLAYGCRKEHCFHFLCHHIVPYMHLKAESCKVFEQLLGGFDEMVSCGKKEDSDIDEQYVVY